MNLSGLHVVSTGEILLGLACATAVVIGTGLAAFFAGLDRGIELEQGRAEQQAADDIDRTVVEFCRPDRPGRPVSSERWHVRQRSNPWGER